MIDKIRELAADPNIIGLVIGAAAMVCMFTGHQDRAESMFFAALAFLRGQK